jgi:hypothetical protein
VASAGVGWRRLASGGGSAGDLTGSGILAVMAKAQTARWWVVRRAQNRKPATYRCPLCGNHLPAFSEHMLIVPEGDAGRRRHAHAGCVLQARRAGRLPTREEWQRTQPVPPRPPGRWARTRARLAGRGR